MERELAAVTSHRLRWAQGSSRSMEALHFRHLKRLCCPGALAAGRLVHFRSDVPRLKLGLHAQHNALAARLSASHMQT